MLEIGLPIAEVSLATEAPIVILMVGTIGTLLWLQGRARGDFKGKGFKMENGVAEVAVAQSADEVRLALVPMLSKNGYQVKSVDRENGILGAVQQHTGREVSIVLQEAEKQTLLTITTSTSAADQIKERRGGTSDQLATVVATRSAANSNTANLAKLIVSQFGSSVA